GGARRGEGEGGGGGGSAPGGGLGQTPKALCRSIFRERCERPKDARNAALSKTMGFSTVCARRPNGRQAQRVEKAGAARLFRHAVAGPGALQIGRASCRERVESWGVAGA